MFIEQQSHLALGHGGATAHVQMDATNKAVIEQYYNFLEDTLLEHKFMDNLAQIYNMNESARDLVCWLP